MFICDEGVAPLGVTGVYSANCNYWTSLRVVLYPHFAHKRCGSPACLSSAILGANISLPKLRGNRIMHFFGMTFYPQRHKLAYGVGISGRSHCTVSISTHLGRALAQTVSRRLPTAAVWVRARLNSCGFCGGQGRTETCFLQVRRFSLSIIHSTNCSKIITTYHTGLVQ
jgi:hypothetical protein